MSDEVRDHDTWVAELEKVAEVRETDCDQVSVAERVLLAVCAVFDDDMLVVVVKDLIADCDDVGELERYEIEGDTE